MNPANMIAFPLIMGVRRRQRRATSCTDYRERDRRKRYMLSRTRAGASWWRLTTILGFGTLMIAQHRGMASPRPGAHARRELRMLTALSFCPPCSASSAPAGRRSRQFPIARSAQRDATFVSRRF